MYQNQLIYNAVFNKGQIYTGAKPDGDIYQKQAEISIGYIQGDKREIRAGMTENVLESDNWYLFNVLDSDNIYYESVAILGVASIDEGRYYAQRYFAETLGANMQTVYVGEYPAKVLKRFLDSATAIENIRIKPEVMERFYNVLVSQTPVWDDDALLSHNGSVRALIADMVANDDHNELLDAMDKVTFAQSIQENEQLDALFTDVTGLTKLARQLTTAIDKQGSDVVRLDKITQSDKPFKRNGMTNLALYLNMNDGQVVSIFFYNPDNTPSKIQPKDTLASWKWVLNSRDVTAALQPETGKDVSIPTLASRIMQLVEKNHSRFVRNKVKLEKENTKIAQLQESISQKQTRLDELDKEIQEWQAKVDELVKNPVIKEELNTKDQPSVEPMQESGQATDEPIVLTGKEFNNHNLDFNLESNKQVLRDEVRQHLQSIAGKNGKLIYNAFLGRDVLFNARGINEMMAWTHQPIKMQILHSIEQIIKNAKGQGEYKQKNKKKTKKANVDFYYHLQSSINLAGKEFMARVVFEEDKDGVLHYDVIVPKGIAENNKALYDALTHDTHPWNTPYNAYEYYDTDIETESQEVMLDAMKQGYVLNLFIFDENGNEIDDLPVDEQDVQDEPATNDTDGKMNLNQDFIIDTGLTKTDYRSELKDAYQEYLNRDDNFENKNLSELDEYGLQKIASKVNSIINYADGKNDGFTSSIARSEVTYRKQIVKMFADLKIPAIPTTYAGVAEWAKKYTPVLKKVLLGDIETAKNEMAILKSQKSVLQDKVTVTAVRKKDTETNLLNEPKQFKNLDEVSSFIADDIMSKFSMSSFSDVIDSHHELDLMLANGLELVLETRLGGKRYFNPYNGTKLATYIKKNYDLSYEPEADDAIQDEPQPADKPQAQDTNTPSKPEILNTAQNPNQRLSHLSSDIVEQLNAKAKQVGFHTPSLPRDAIMGIYRTEKSITINGKKHCAYIIGRFKNSHATEDKLADYDYRVEVDTAPEYYLTTNDFDEALAYANKALTELEKTPNEPVIFIADITEYLNDMANGKIALSVENMQTHIQKIKQYAIALEPHKEYAELVDKAVEAYQAFALSVKVQ